MSLDNKVSQFDGDADIARQIIHGDATTSVMTNGGLVRSLAKLVADSASYIADIAGFKFEADTYTQLRAYTGALRTALVLADGIKGTFVRDTADATSTDNGGTVIIDGAGRRWKRIFSGEVHLSWFGVDNTGAADIYSALATASATVAAAGSKYHKTLRLGTGTFRLNTPWLGDSGVSLFGAGAGQTTVNFYGAGIALTPRSGSFGGLTVASKAAGQSGVMIRNGGGLLAVDVVCLDFDTIGFQLGYTTNGGCYECTVDRIRCINNTTPGQIGFVIDGGGTASTNNNTLSNIVVSGKWATLYDVRGNDNKFIGGCDAAPNHAGQPVTEIFKISGGCNTFDSMYIEPVGATYPPIYWRFAAGADGNRFYNTYLLSTGGINVDSKIDNQAANNEVQINPSGYNFPQSPGVPRNHTNWLVNAAFNAVDPTTAMPVGWAKNTTGTSTVTRDDTHVRGNGHSMRLHCVGDGSAEMYGWPATATPTAANRKAYFTYPVARFAGKTITVGAWCWSATPGFGALKVRTGSGGTWGTMKHSGSSKWEFLTASVYVDPSVTEVGINFRSDANNAASTGDCWFTEPIFCIGNEVPQSAQARHLTEHDAVLVGRFCMGPWQTFTDGDTTPSVQESNLFRATNTVATTITNFTNGREGQLVYLRPTNANTTVANNANITTTTAANKLLTANVIYKFLYDSASAKWFEMS